MENVKNPRPGATGTGAGTAAAPNDSDTLFPSAKAYTTEDVHELLASVAARDVPWQTIAAAFIDKLAATGRPFEAADLTAAGCPAPANANQWGAAFRVASGRGVIVPVGIVPAARRSRHRALVRLWQGAGVDA